MSLDRSFEGEDLSMATVLIVDDSRTSRRMLRELLEKLSFEVVDEAINGEEGFLKYKEHNPDLVTLDITMPKLDGIEALQLIRKYNPEAKAVMITAAGQREKMVQAVKYGAVEFITKPYEEEEVAKILKRVMN